MRAKDVLLESLQKFTGTVVFVSHDRYFIDKLATRIFEVGDGQIQVFPGNYEDYLWRKQGKPLELDLPLNGHHPAPVVAAAALPQANAKRINPMRLRQMQDRCQEIEGQIAATESDIAGYEQALANFVSTGETLRLTGLIETRRKALSTLLAEWEKVSQELETAG
jgi:ATP-binding cassette subfamily F protein 3